MKSSKWLRWPLLAVVFACRLALGAAASSVAAEPLDYAPTDPNVAAVLIDSSERESFLAVQTDTLGRLFVGGREAIFVYEPNDRGGYKPRQELYRFPDHTWVYDIAVRGEDLYALTVSCLYVLPGAAARRSGIEARPLVWGVPMGHVHQCFHGLALGPEGDVYFAMGDPLWYYGDFNRPDHWGHWTFFSQPDGRATPYNGVGGVFRCRPDGSELRIVARGLRNSCGLAFDEHWNLFTNDNDHESMPAQYVPARLVHVVDHGYYNWPRGWLASKSPDRADILETMFEGLGRAVPVGQAYYGDTLLPEYRGNLLIARWCIRSITRYPLVRHGASFRVTERHVLDGQNQARPVGVCVGRGGRIFATLAYMAQNEASPVYRSDLIMLTPRDDEADHPFEPYDAVRASEEKLFDELSNVSWSRRSAAHQEIMRRGGSLHVEARRRLARVRSTDPHRESLVWLGGVDIANHWLAMIADMGDPALRLQAVRAISRYWPSSADQLSAELVDRLLRDDDLQISQAMLAALFESEQPIESRSAVFELAKSKDSYVRQTAALLLAERARLDVLDDLARSKDPKLRLAAVLAAGFRLTLPPATAAIAPQLPLDKLNVEEAYFVQIGAEKIDLRTRGRIGNYTIADHWKAAPPSEEQERLFSLLFDLLRDRDEAVRLQAGHFLSLLNDPRSEPVVGQVIADTEEKRLSTAKIRGLGKVWAVGPFDDGAEGLNQVHPPEVGPVDLSATFSVVEGKSKGAAPQEDSKISWRIIDPSPNHYNFAKSFGYRDRASHYAYVRLESASRQRVQLLVGSDDGVRVWHNGRVAWTNETTRGALPIQDVVPLMLEPGSNDLLMRVNNITGESGLYLHLRSLGEVEPTLPDKLDVAGLTERLASAAADGADKLPEGFLDVDWQAEITRADLDRGRKLFEAVGCAKCHAVKMDSGQVGGPSLADARRRFTLPYLVESVLLPNRQVSPVFRATQVVTVDGQTQKGLLVGETAERLELLLADGKRLTLDKSQIEAREATELSPMPYGIVKEPGELRDILGWLLSTPDTTGREEENSESSKSDE